MLKFLGVNPKFIIGKDSPRGDTMNESNFNQSQHIEEEHDNLRDNLTPGRSSHSQVLYVDAVKCLEKI